MTEPVIVLCDCLKTSARKVYLYPSLDDRFLVGECKHCNKKHYKTVDSGKDWFWGQNGKTYIGEGRYDRHVD